MMHDKGLTADWDIAFDEHGPAAPAMAEDAYAPLRPVTRSPQDAGFGPYHDAGWTPSGTVQLPLPGADMVSYPPHYTAHPSGVECIQITEHMTMCLGTVIKYIWRSGLKGNTLEDLKKAKWYLEREIARLGG